MDQLTMEPPDTRPDHRMPFAYVGRLVLPTSTPVKRIKWYPTFFVQNVVCEGRCSFFL